MTEASFSEKPLSLSAATPSSPAGESANQEAFTIPGYTILGPLGAGGMGEVFKATRDADQSLVAVKVLTKELSNAESVRGRFNREAKSLAQLEHPSITRFLDRGETSDGRLFLAMEYVSGDSLRRVLADGRFELKTRMDIVLQAARSLAYTHDMNLVHRDIKPENIMICGTAEPLLVKILDFGLVRTLDPDWNHTSLTREGSNLGTPLYMSPEQHTDPSGVDARGDIYSLGVIFYELMTGDVPVGRYRPPQEINREVPIGIGTIIDRMLDPVREDRYPKMEEAVEDLELVMEGKSPIHARAEDPAPLKVLSPPRSSAAQLSSPVPASPPRPPCEADTRPGLEPLSRHEADRPTRKTALPQIPVEDAGLEKSGLGFGWVAIVALVVGAFGMGARFSAPGDIVFETIEASRTTRIKGVADGAVTLQFVINGRSQSVRSREDGTFEAPLELNWGSNQVRIEQLDGTRVVQSREAPPVQVPPPVPFDVTVTDAGAEGVLVAGSAQGADRVIVRRGRKDHELTVAVSESKFCQFSGRVPVSPGKNDLSVISLKDDVESSEVVVTYVAPPAPPELLDNRLSEDGQSILIRGRSPSRDARIVATCGTIEKSTISKPDRSFALPFPVAPGENHIKVRAFLEDEGLDGSRPVELTVVGPPPPPVVIEKILSPNGRDVVLVVRSAPGTSVNVVVPGVAVPAILEPVEGSFRSDPLPLHGGENSFYLRTLQGSQRSRATTCVVVIEE